MWTDGRRLAVVEAPRQVAFHDASLSAESRVWFGDESQAALLASGPLGDGVAVISGTGVGGENDLIVVTPDGSTSSRLAPGEHRLFPADGTERVWMTRSGDGVGIVPVDADGEVGELIIVDDVRFLFRAGEIDGTVWVSAPEDALLIGVDPASGEVTARVELPAPNVTVAAVTPGTVWLESRAGGPIHRYSIDDGELATITVDVPALAAVPAVRSGVVRLDDDRMAAVVYHDDGTEPVVVLTTVDIATAEVGPVRTVGGTPFAMAAVDGDLFVLHDERRLADVDVDDLLDDDRAEPGAPLAMLPAPDRADGVEAEVVAAFLAVYDIDAEAEAAAAAMEGGAELADSRLRALQALAGGGVASVEVDAVWVEEDLGWVEWSGVDEDGSTVLAARRALFVDTGDGWVSGRDELCAQFLQVGVVCG